MSEIHNQGSHARESGMAIVDCPYPWPSPAAEKWVRGWVGMLVAERLEQDLPTPLIETWRSDGCSLVRWPWKMVTGRDPRWSLACVEHDVAYWLGDAGELTRAEADALLRFRIGHDYGASGWGWVYWLGVRPGGVPWSGLPWRWGYGW